MAGLVHWDARRTHTVLKYSDDSYGNPSGAAMERCLEELESQLGGTSKWRKQQMLHLLADYRAAESSSDLPPRESRANPLTGLRADGTPAGPPTSAGLFAADYTGFTRWEGGLTNNNAPEAAPHTQAECVPREIAVHPHCAVIRGAASALPVRKLVQWAEQSGFVQPQRADDGGDSTELAGHRWRYLIDSSACDPATGTPRYGFSRVCTCRVHACDVWAHCDHCDAGDVDPGGIATLAPCGMPPSPKCMHT